VSGRRTVGRSRESGKTVFDGGSWIAPVAILSGPDTGMSNGCGFSRLSS